MNETESGKQVAVLGAGALGGYFGICLSVAGAEVAFGVRSQAEALRREGYVLELEDGRELRLERPRVFTPEEAGTVGEAAWIIVGLKTTQNERLPELLRPLVGKRTRLLTVQNGLGNVELLEAAFPGRPVVGGLCQIGVNREGVGRIRNFVPGGGFVQLGAGASAGEAEVTAWAELLEGAGIRVKRAASLGDALWRKLMWNVPFNGLTVALGGTGTDVVCGEAGLRAVARGLMEEIRAAAATQGVVIESEYTDKLLRFTDKLGDYRASSVLDWQAGRPLEVEAIFGKPLAAGRAAGVAMPRLETLTAVLGGLDGQRAKKS